MNWTSQQKTHTLGFKLSWISPYTFFVYNYLSSCFLHIVSKPNPVIQPNWSNLWVVNGPKAHPSCDMDVKGLHSRGCVRLWLYNCTINASRYTRGLGWSYRVYVSGYCSKAHYYCQGGAMSTCEKWSWTAQGNSWNTCVGSHCITGCVHQMNTNTYRGYRGSCVRVTGEE